MSSNDTALDARKQWLYRRVAMLLAAGIIFLIIVVLPVVRDWLLPTYVYEVGFEKQGTLV